MRLSERFNNMIQNEQRIAELKLDNKNKKKRELAKKEVQLFLDGEQELLPVLDRINKKGRTLGFKPIDACLSLVQRVTRGAKVIHLEQCFELSPEQERMDYEDLEKLSSQLESYVSENLEKWLRQIDSEIKFSTGKVTNSIRGNLLIVSGRHIVCP